MEATITPIVSIVMIAYNDGRYIADILNSILAQTFSNFEIILIDNSSTDNTAEVIAGFSDPRLRSFRNENVGLSEGYNIGIAKARGEYIAISNADDLWKAQKLEKQLELMQDESVGVVFCTADLIDDNGRQLSDEEAKNYPFNFENRTSEENYQRLFFNSNYFCAPSALIRKELLQQRPFDAMLIQLQDFEMWLHLVQKKAFKTVQESCFQYRVRLDGSNLSLSQKNKSRVAFELGIVYRHFFDNVDQNFFKRAFASHLRNPDFNSTEELEFEKGFLYLKMQHPAIYALGLEKLYELMSNPTSRKFGEERYKIKMRDVWEQALLPVYNDPAQFHETVNQLERLNAELKCAQNELAQVKSTMNAITSGKFWKLREKVYRLLGKS